MRDSAKVKCDIIAKALKGSKIDAAKLVPDGKGGFKTGKIIPVKTDFSMNTEKRAGKWSIRTFLKKLFGFALSIQDKIEKANQKSKDYQTKPEKTKSLAAAAKMDEAFELRSNIDKNDVYKLSMDIDFFGDSFPTTDSNINRAEYIGK